MPIKTHIKNSEKVFLNKNFFFCHKNPVCLIISYPPPPQTEVKNFGLYYSTFFSECQRKILGRYISFKSNKFIFRFNNGKFKMFFKKIRTNCKISQF